MPLGANPFMQFGQQTMAFCQPTMPFGPHPFTQQPAMSPLMQHPAMAAMMMAAMHPPPMLASKVGPVPPPPPPEEEGDQWEESSEEPPAQPKKAKTNKRSDEPTEEGIDKPRTVIVLETRGGNGRKKRKASELKLQLATMNGMMNLAMRRTLQFLSRSKPWAAATRRC